MITHTGKRRSFCACNVLFKYSRVGVAAAAKKVIGSSTEVVMYMDHDHNLAVHGRHLLK